MPPGAFLFYGTSFHDITIHCKAMFVRYGADLASTAQPNRCEWRGFPHAQRVGVQSCHPCKFEFLYIFVVAGQGTCHPYKYGADLASTAQPNRCEWRGFPHAF
jgi:hypothetical protein